MEKEKKERMDKLTELKQVIESMEAIHHPKILEILKTNNIHISSNRNGCFINIITDTIPSRRPTSSF